MTKTISIAQLGTCNASHGFGYAMVMRIALMVATRLMKYAVCYLPTFAEHYFDIYYEYQSQVTGSAAMEVSNAQLEILLA